MSMTQEQLKRWRESGREFLAGTPTTTNDDQRTVDVIFFTGAPVARTDSWSGDRYMLILDPQGVDLSWLNNGAPVFDHHQNEGAASQMGVVETARIDPGGQYRATLRFSKRPEVDGLWQDIRDGIVNKFSMGLELLATTEQRDETGKLATKTATAWRPFEISTEPLPADFGTTTLSRAETREGKHMTDNNEKTNTGALASETINTATDIADIRTIALRNGVGAMGEDLISRNVPIQQARELLWREVVRKSDLDANGQPFRINSEHISLTRDYREGLTDRMSEALAARYTGKTPSESARQFVGASVVDLARECCLAGGVQLPGFGAERIVKLAMASTSDFPNLLQATGNRVLLNAYQAAKPSLQRVARPSTIVDFRAKSALRLGGVPQLLEVNEGGEIHSGSPVESKESYRLYTYGRKFGISRQAMVNDDLSAFVDFIGRFGIAAANLEAQKLVDLLASNPTMGDGKVLFVADHSNLATGAGSALAISGLSAARLKLRTTTDLDGVTIIETTPRYLVVPACLETSGEQLLSAIMATEIANVNPFSGKLELIVEPRLDAKSKTAWYVFGDPQVAPVLEYAYLDSLGGPQVETRPGWETLGMEIRCFLDYGVGAIGWRGAVLNTGVA
jgi:hypothetical protein